VKVIGIMGSPRMRGNTDLLLDAVLEGATGAGADCRKVVVNKLNIRPCQHCGGCERLHGEGCVQKDDMTDLYEPLRTADRIVVASPMFFMSLTAQAKTVIDRCQPFWCMKYIEKKPTSDSEHPRKGLFIGVGGCGFETLFDSSRLIMRSVFAILDVGEWDELTFRSIEGRGEIADHATALTDALEAGKRLAMP